MINTSGNHHHEIISSGRAMPCLQGDSGLVLTTDPKPRLRWTVELHERFVDAVTQLGGPDSEYTTNLNISDTQIVCFDFYQLG